MSPEKESHLKTKFPKIFTENFYFECGDGWFDLIDCLCDDIQNYVDWKCRNLSQEDSITLQVEASQVKEKFGGLRFNYYGGDDEISGMVSFAETFSYKICEGCGSRGKVYQQGWHRTHCEPCEKEYQEKRKANSTT